MDDIDMLKFATRQGHDITVERYTNHGRLIPGKKWVVVRHRLLPRVPRLRVLVQPRAAVEVQRVRRRCLTHREQVDHLAKYAARPGTNGWVQVREDPHAEYKPEVRDAVG